jgi:hypothetical protein
MNKTTTNQLRWVITGLLIALPLGFGPAALGADGCGETEAFGGGRTEIQIENVKTIQITCNSCFGCITPEGDPDYYCDTECDTATDPPPDGYITPTLVVEVWNAETGHWDIVHAEGSCQQYTTYDCWF